MASAFAYYLSNYPCIIYNTSNFDFGSIVLLVLLGRGWSGGAGKIGKLMVIFHFPEVPLVFSSR
jgi:hypothetical protein